MKIKQLKSITSKINFGKPYKTPQPVNEDLPRIYNIMLVCGSKGSGKGVIVNHYLQLAEKSGYKMENGEKVHQRIIWVSGGTSKSKQNQILDELKYLHEDDRIDLDLSNPDKQLKEIYESILEERDLIEIYNIYRETYKKFMKSKSLSNLTMDELTLLEWKGFIDPKDDPDAPHTEDGTLLYHPRVIHFVLDDLIGSDVFSNVKKGNWCNNISIKSRHDSDKLCPINLIYLTQDFKKIPSVVRKQSDYFILLKNANRIAIIDAISTEVGSIFSKEELETVYDGIMHIPYASLIISIHKNEKQENRLRLGWGQTIERDPKYVFDK
tara:strand:- start:11398 stop:12369 length:972 start_codon:yes stop_codon:yes gene_type:complete